MLNRNTRGTIFIQNHHGTISNGQPFAYTEVRREFLTKTPKGNSVYRFHLHVRDSAGRIARIEPEQIEHGFRTMKKAIKALASRPGMVPMTDEYRLLEDGRIVGVQATMPCVHIEYRTAKTPHLYEHGAP